MKIYDAYKPSGIEWIGKMPAKWDLKRGKYIVRLLSGFPADSDLFTDDNSCMPLIRIRDIDNTTTETFYKGYYPIEYLIKNKDILVGMDGDFNIAKWKGSDAILNQRVCKIIGTNEMYAHYAFYLFQTPLKLINDVTYSTTVKHLSTNDIKDYRFPVPPLHEQAAIADYLDAKCAKIDNVVAVQQKRIELLKELKQSIITRAVTKGLDKNAKMKDSGVKWIGEVPEGWKVMKTLYCLAMPITDGPHETPVLRESGISFISAEAISNGYINFDLQRGYISKDYYEECCKKYTPQLYDVYMIKSGATTGQCAIVNTTETFTIWSPLAVFRANTKKILPYYLFYVLRSDYYQKQVEISWSYGTQQNIGMRVLESLKIAIPELPEQTAIINYLDKKCAIIDRQIAKIEKQIELLNEYKQSVITECVTGKRKVC